MTIETVPAPSPGPHLGYPHPPVENRFPPGQSGNPAGRRRGSRNRLNERFLDALCEDFDAHGVSVIETVRKTNPAVYLRVVARLVPAHVLVQEARLDVLTDDELSAYLAVVRQALDVQGGAGGRGEAQDPCQQVEILPPVSEAEIVP
ncbi:MAG: DUF5681 domain-containing protein [Micropepsaceae bacterium]